MTTIFRGATINFAVTFTDNEGGAFTPDEATLYISYVSSVNGSRSIDTVQMDGAGAAFSAIWQSSVAYPGRVNWSIRTAGPGVQVVAKDGHFTLFANEANPAS